MDNVDLIVRDIQELKRKNAEQWKKHDPHLTWWIIAQEKAFNDALTIIAKYRNAKPVEILN